VLASGAAVPERFWNDVLVLNIATCGVAPSAI